MVVVENDYDASVRTLLVVTDKNTVQKSKSRKRKERFIGLYTQTTECGEIGF